MINKLKNIWVVKNLAVTLTAAAICSAIATYVAITHSSSPFGPDPQKVLGLILIDLILLLALSSVISLKIARLWLAKRRGYVGSRLQMRIIVMFSMVSVVPTIIVAVFSVLFFNYGIQSWFDERVGIALEESVAVADGYLAEHKENIRADALAMARDLNNQSFILSKNPQRFKHVVSTQAVIRSLTEAIVFQSNSILAKTNLSFALVFELEKLQPDVMEKAAKGEVVILTSDDDNRVRAIVKLNNFFDTYLMVGRFVDSNVLDHITRTKGSVDEYKRLKAGISKLQIQFSFIFIAVALLLLLAALWIGMIFAGELATPITALIKATERVKAGALDTRVEDGPRNDEIATLGKAFNRMTDQLQKQRKELIEVNTQINAKRRLTEAVLSGVSAGVISLDKRMVITMFNKSAMTLLSADINTLSNNSLLDVLPEVGGLLKKASTDVVQDEITIVRKNRKSTLLVRIVTEEFIDEIEGYVVTFDDITELLTAQRSAAWSDVARRIAHEIKNPITPIHLAAERLRRKYQKEISTDPEVFGKYIDTITRHTDNIGKIVEEFVNFARMPLPVLTKQNICNAIRDAIFSEEVVNPHIIYDLIIPEKPVYINGDSTQISQALINLLKNSSEAIGKEKQGIISITVKEGKNIVIKMEDNGRGFPEDLIDRIMEPYITTRKTGTGLGLAVVHKVIDDHDGKIFVSNIMDNDVVKGASVVLSFPQLIEKKNAYN